MFTAGLFKDLRQITPARSFGAVIVMLGFYCRINLAFRCICSVFFSSPCSILMLSDFPYDAVSLARRQCKTGSQLIAQQLNRAYFDHIKVYGFKQLTVV